MKRFAIACVIAGAMVSNVMAEGINIFQTTMAEYVSANSDTNHAMKTAAGAYVEAIRMELDKVRGLVAEKMSVNTQLGEDFIKLNDSFEEYVKNATLVREDVGWVNFQTGDKDLGSAYGYVALDTAASAYWNQLLYYMRLNNCIDNGGCRDIASNPLLSAQKIGGYVEELCTGAPAAPVSAQNGNFNQLYSTSAADLGGSISVSSADYSGTIESDINVDESTQQLALLTYQLDSLVDKQESYIDSCVTYAPATNAEIARCKTTYATLKLRSTRLQGSIEKFLNENGEVNNRDFNDLLRIFNQNISFIQEAGDPAQFEKEDNNNLIEINF